MRLSDEELRRLYLDQGLSTTAIGVRCGYSSASVLRWLRTAGIGRRDDGGVQRYARADFSGDACEKAYLVGFRIGDLHVAPQAHSVVIKCTSTRPEQIELFKLLFAPYGHVYTDEATMGRRRRQTIGMSVCVPGGLHGCRGLHSDLFATWLHDASMPGRGPIVRRRPAGSTRKRAQCAGDRLPSSAATGKSGVRQQVRRAEQPPVVGPWRVSPGVAGCAVYGHRAIPAPSTTPARHACCFDVFVI
jgi:hypothetical protein